MTSILTLLALYVLYSEPIKLPVIIKKNKKLCYVLVVGLYFYYYQTNVENYLVYDGPDNTPPNYNLIVPLSVVIGGVVIIGIVVGVVAWLDRKIKR